HESRSTIPTLCGVVIVLSTLLANALRILFIGFNFGIFFGTNDSFGDTAKLGLDQRIILKALKGLRR
ncbi:hypothetical protein FPOAC2_03737, partial [Fusarium poae]